MIKLRKYHNTAAFLQAARMLTLSASAFLELQRCSYDMGVQAQERGCGTLIPFGFFENTVCFDTWDSPEPLVRTVVRYHRSKGAEWGKRGRRLCGIQR